MHAGGVACRLLSSSLNRFPSVGPYRASLAPQLTSATPLRSAVRRAKHNPRALEMAEAELKRIGGAASSSGSGEGDSAESRAPAVVAMVCRDFICERPAKSAKELRAQLKNAAAPNGGGDHGGGGGVKLMAQKVPFSS